MTFLSMRNTFNNLLMVLACLDSTFLVLAMLDYSIARGHHHTITTAIITFVMVITRLNIIAPLSI